MLYLAEDPDHAVAEKIARFRGGSIGPAHLREFGLPLGLVSVRLPDSDRGGLADLCDPGTLVALAVRPDQIAARERETSQAVARTVVESGAIGLRWWSSFFGEWHGIVVFPHRLDGPLEFGEPKALGPGDLALTEALEALGMRWSDS